MRAAFHAPKPSAANDPKEGGKQPTKSKLRWAVGCVVPLHALEVGTWHALSSNASEFAESLLLECARGSAPSAML